MVEQDLAVAQAEQQLREDRNKEQKAIRALYLRMAELEEQVEYYASPRMTFAPKGSTRISDIPGAM